MNSELTQKEESTFFLLFISVHESVKNKTLWWQYLHRIRRLVFLFLFFSWIRPVVAEPTFCLSTWSVSIPAAHIWLLFSFRAGFSFWCFLDIKVVWKTFFYYYYCNRKADTILSSRKKKIILYVQSCLQISFVCYKFLHCLYKQICSEKTLSAGRSAGIFIFLLRSSGRLVSWDRGTALSTDVRALGPWSARGSWWALLLHSQLFGQNVRTPQEAIQPVRHFQGGQDCRCCVVKGMMFVCIYLWVHFLVSRGSVCSLLYLCPSGWCRGEGQVEELLLFSVEMILSVIKSYHVNYYHFCN